VNEIEIFALAQLRAWLWAKFGGLRCQGSFSDWCMHPLDCLREIR